jgi:glycosyltransferase involved in cell wall biosynthesis
MRIALIAGDINNDYRVANNKWGGVTYYRLFLPKLGLEEITDWKVDLWGNEFLDEIDATNQETVAQSYVDFFNKYDAVVIKHFDNPNAGRFLAFASDYTGTPIITDLDDNVLKVRDDQPASKKGYSKGDEKLAVVGTMISFSKGLFVTNDFLGKQIQKDVKAACGVDIPYYVLPNTNNLEEWAKYKSKTNKDKVVIGWHGSLTHDADLKSIKKPLERLLKEYPHVHLALLGGVSSDLAIEMFKDWDLEVLNRIELIRGTESWHNFPYHLMKQRWDIGIAPLINDDFNKSKSNIKWLEYAMKKIPCVASDVLPYKTIEHDKTGKLCKTQKDWYESLKELIEDPVKRRKLGSNAFREVKANWQYKDRANEWKEAFEDVLKKN